MSLVWDPDYDWTEVSGLVNAVPWPVVDNLFTNLNITLPRIEENTVDAETFNTPKRVNLW